MKVSSGRFFALLAIVIAVFVMLVANRGVNNVPTVSDKPIVVTSFYPLHFFVSRVGGDAVAVYNVTPPGAEPHDYEPTTGDLSRMENSALVVINGAGLESWGGHVKTTLENKHVSFLETASLLATLKSTEEGEGEVLDPHIWLDPVLMQEQVKIITNALVSALPQSTELFRKNEQRELTRLQDLDREFVKELSSCSSQNIVTSHQAFGYLAKRYGLTQLAVSGISPDTEPSSRDIALLIDFVKKNRVKYIFSETLVSPKIAEAIASETGAALLVFNPLEGLTDEEVESGADYYSIMNQNLGNLRKALECK